LKEEALWLKFLSRWMFLMPIPVLLLFTAVGSLISVSGDTPMGLAYMVAGSEKPFFLRLLGLALTLLWGSVIVFFLALARLYRHQHPLQSTFLGALAVGFIIPMSAGNAQWTIGLDMAKRYGEAAPETQEMIRQIQMTVFQFVESRIDMANLLWGVGILLFISIARSVKNVPTYILVLYFISALIMLTVFVSHIVGFTFPFVLIPVYWLATLAGHISLGFAFAKQAKMNRSIVPAEVSA